MMTLYVAVEAKSFTGLPARRRERAFACSPACPPPSLPVPSLPPTPIPPARSLIQRVIGVHAQ